MENIQFLSLNTNLSTLTETHHIPCLVNFNGPAATDKYLICEQHSTNKNNMNNKLTTYLRGRELIGERTKLEGGNYGFVLKKQNKDQVIIEQNENRQIQKEGWESCASFNVVTSWSHQNINQNLQQAFNWMTVAQALQKDVTEEEIQSRLLSEE
eukprot:TRINITY_DN10928_c2_g1_i1.p2 TRINITY_DN10928_c2_g1~~TRINITY_DN10928_c2_g1_i1.p2  ORF type:complete len:172 (-),score=6.19 TRINITY_DN10928_c2_g1_i1:230-691(-)